MRPAIIAPLLLGFLTGAAAFAQAPQPQKPPAPNQTPVIRTTAGEVLLDMVVRDKHHHLVTNLRPDEVAVYEDGVRQDVKSFRLVQGAEELQQERGEQQAGAQPPTGPSSAPQNRLQQVNFVSIVFGPTAPLNREFAREAVDDFLKSDSLPNTYVTVYLLGHSLSLAQPYTADKNVLTAVVDKIAKTLSSSRSTGASNALAGNAITESLANSAAAASSSTQPGPGNPDPMLGQFSGAIYSSPLWARNAAAQDASLPLSAALEAQGLLWISQRFDSSEGLSAVDALRELVGSQEKLPGRKVVLYLSDGLALPAGRPEVFQNLISFANRAGVTFYTVDTRGLSVESSTIPGLADMGMTAADSRQRGAVTSQNPAAGYKEMDDVELATSSNRQLSMRELAESTGGFAVTNTNEIAAPMRQVMEDIRTHYVLSYAPKSTNYDGHFRHIEVKLTRPKLTVQTRKGYYALPTLNGEPLLAYEAAALDKINAHPEPVDFRYTAALMRFRSDAAYTEYMAGIEVPVSVLKPVAIPKTNTSRVQISIVALVRDAQGEVVAKISRELWRKIASQNPPAGDHIFYSQPLVLPRGRYVADVVVTDELSGRASVQRLSVPAEPASQLSLSSLEIVGKAEPLAGPADPLNPFQIQNVQIMPELGDAISSGGTVNLYFILYPAKLEGASSAELTLDLLRDGNPIGHQPLQVSSPRPDGSIPMLVRLSPGPGSYAIIVTARQGKLVAQAARSVEIQ